MCAVPMAVSWRRHSRHAGGHHGHCFEFLWVVEQDVACSGGITRMLRAYDDSSADLIVPRNVSELGIRKPQD